MKKIIFYLAFFVIALISSSCATDHVVVYRNYPSRGIYTYHHYPYYYNDYYYYSYRPYYYHNHHHYGHNKPIPPKPHNNNGIPPKPTNTPKPNATVRPNGGTGGSMSGTRPSNGNGSGTQIPSNTTTIRRNGSPTINSGVRSGNTGSTGGQRGGSNTRSSSGRK